MNFSIEEIRSDKIRDFFIIHKSGYTLFHRAYINSKVDEQLLSGFLSAIFALSKEISNNNIQQMNMQDLKFIYDTHDPYIYVLNVVDDVDIDFGKHILSRTKKYFDSFCNNLSKEEKSDLNNLSRLLKDSDFESKIDEEIDNALIQSYFDSPEKLLDEIESYVVSLFGSMGNTIIDSAIEKQCRKRSNFTKDDLKGLIDYIEEQFLRKVNPNQTKMIINQIKDTFL